MDKIALSEYQNWIGKTPTEIVKHVKKVGGWGAVFRKDEAFPAWASRIRNYFNTSPRHLNRIQSGLVGFLPLDQVAHAINSTIMESCGVITTPDGLGKHKLAFSGDVYVDNDWRKWLQINQAGILPRVRLEGSADFRRRCQINRSVMELTHGSIAPLPSSPLPN
jgi:hypothetical protein